MDQTNEPKRGAIQVQPLIAVRDVRASSRWYQTLLGFDGLPDHAHRDFYDRLLCDGRLILQLHAWDAEDHANLVGAELRRTATASCCGSKWPTSTPSSLARGRCTPRSSRMCTSIPRPPIASSGSAIPMAP